MKSLVPALAISLLAAGPAFAAAYTIDPIAAAAYVRQQVETQVTQPMFFGFSTTPQASVDAACSDFAWRYDFDGAAIPAAGTPAPANPAMKSGTLVLSLKLQNNKCVWDRTIETHDGIHIGVYAINDFLFGNRLIGPDRAVAIAQTVAPATLSVAAIALSGAPVVPNSSGHPTYTVSSGEGVDLAVYQIDAVDGTILGHSDVASSDQGGEQQGQQGQQGQQQQGQQGQQGQQQGQQGQQGQQQGQGGQQGG